MGLSGILTNFSSNSPFTDPLSSLEGINWGVSDAEGSAAQGCTVPPPAPTPEVPGEMEETSSSVPWESGEQDQQPPQPVSQGGKLQVWRGSLSPLGKGVVILSGEKCGSLAP